MDSVGVSRALSSLWQIFYDLTHRPPGMADVEEVRRLLKIVEDGNVNVAGFRDAADELCLFVRTSGIFDEPRVVQAVDQVRRRVDELRRMVARS